MEGRSNDRRRICLRFVGGDAFDVEIVDYRLGMPTMTKSGLPTIHPGEFLAEILDEIGVSQAGFARAVGESAMRVSHVIRGTRPVTAELALLFGKAFGQSPEYWLNLQSAYDLETVRKTSWRRLKSVQTVVPAG